MIAISEQAELEKKKLICYYVFCFHGLNLPLLAAGAAFGSASFCLGLCYLDHALPGSFAQKQNPPGSSATVIS